MTYYKITSLTKPVSEVIKLDNVQLILIRLRLFFSSNLVVQLSE